MQKVYLLTIKEIANEVGNMECDRRVAMQFAGFAVVGLSSSSAAAPHNLVRTAAVIPDIAKALDASDQAVAGALRRIAPAMDPVCAIAFHDPQRGRDLRTLADRTVIARVVRIVEPFVALYTPGVLRRLESGRADFRRISGCMLGPVTAAIYSTGFTRMGVIARSEGATEPSRRLLLDPGKGLCEPVGYSEVTK
ncbi:hypothetical protein SZ64_00680 [Erythrobacter sp. SG61-1L]|uniref:hypothetical protein n=1 Tax=Erythrobacter sp. SG61-1L TaxID=1603897 RepID=UPI0006C93897|nr:hypothetical protein [Erythrobacter sp. SG61-1L]KPL66744.1 hypothetical protein SZ64_00680 [Erythrobacter sp. SG61-1L]